MPFPEAWKSLRKKTIEVLDSKIYTLFIENKYGINWSEGKHEEGKAYDQGNQEDGDEGDSLEDPEAARKRSFHHDWLGGC